MKTITGDLLGVKKGFIVQQTNCVTTRGAGLAGAIEKRFKFCNVYKKRINKDGSVTQSEPGTYEVFVNPESDEDPVVVCLMAQFAPGSSGNYLKGYITPEGVLDTYIQRLQWFHESMSKFLHVCARNKVDFRVEPVCIPYHIGCGLAGGDWKAYENLLHQIEREHGMEFNMYKLETEKD